MTTKFKKVESFECWCDTILLSRKYGLENAFIYLSMHSYRTGCTLICWRHFWRRFRLDKLIVLAILICAGHVVQFFVTTSELQDSITFENCSYLCFRWLCWHLNYILQLETKTSSSTVETLMYVGRLIAHTLFLSWARNRSP